MFDSLLLSVVVDYAPNLSNTSDTYYLQFEVHCPTAAKDRPIHISPWHPVSYFSNNGFQKSLDYSPRPCTKSVKKVLSKYWVLCQNVILFLRSRVESNFEEMRYFLPQCKYKVSTWLIVLVAGDSIYFLAWQMSRQNFRCFLHKG